MARKQAVFQTFKESEEENIQLWSKMTVEQRFEQFDKIRGAFKYMLPTVQAMEDNEGYIVLKQTKQPRC